MSSTNCVSLLLGQLSMARRPVLVWKSFLSETFQLSSSPILQKHKRHKKGMGRGKGRGNYASSWPSSSFWDVRTRWVSPPHSWGEFLCPRLASDSLDKKVIKIVCQRVPSLPILSLLAAINPFASAVLWEIHVFKEWEHQRYLGYKKEYQESGPQAMDKPG